jgi:hypothetical protein
MDAQIAATLEREGYQTPGLIHPITSKIVCHLRAKWKIPTVKLNQNQHNPAQWEDGSYSVEGGSRKAGCGPEHDFQLVENRQADGRTLSQRHALENLFDGRRCHPTSRMASTCQTIKKRGIMTYSRKSW